MFCEGVGSGGGMPRIFRRRTKGCEAGLRCTPFGRCRPGRGWKGRGLSGGTQRCTLLSAGKAAKATGFVETVSGLTARIWSFMVRVASTRRGEVSAARRVARMTPQLEQKPTLRPCGPATQIPVTLDGPALTEHGRRCSTEKRTHVGDARSGSTCIGSEQAVRGRRRCTRLSE